MQDSGGNVGTGPMFNVIVNGTAASGINVTIPAASSGAALNLDAGAATSYIIKTPLNHGVSQFNQLESTSANHSLTGSIRMGGTDPVKYRDVNRTGGAVDAIALQGVQAINNPGFPFLFSAQNALQIGDLGGVLLGGPLTSLSPGISMTIQPYGQIAGNVNGANLNLIYRKNKNQFQEKGRRVGHHGPPTDY